MAKKIKFTEEQEKAYQVLLSGQNVFLTGEAGTGKSFVLNAFLKDCKKKKKNVLAMAPTGIAALNLAGGSTIHRTLSIRPNFCDPAEELGFPKEVLKTADIIVIDEISMVRIDLFERVMRMILKAERATKKKQVILVGDFYQLPPVVSEHEEEAMAEYYKENIQGYCFKSKFWKGLNLNACILKKVVRTTQEEYINALNQARNGDEKCIDYFNKRSVRERDLAPRDAIWLCVRNRNADAINEQRLSELPGEEWTCIGEEKGIVGKGDKPTNDIYQVKVGARVMALVNDSEGKYQNGSLGTVIDIDGYETTYNRKRIKEAAAVTVRFDNGKIAYITEYEWKVEKATVHQTKDKEGNLIKKIKNEKIGSFRQIPLRLAWAVTIHKSQGQTFDKVNCETSVFQAGMMYVGLSRCTSIEGLHIYPYLWKSRLYAQEEVVNFYRDLELGKKTVFFCKCGAMSQIETDAIVRFCPVCGMEYES